MTRHVALIRWQPFLNRVPLSKGCGSSMFVGGARCQLTIVLLDLQKEE
jgi:hypothetical protein